MWKVVDRRDLDVRSPDMPVLTEQTVELIRAAAECYPTRRSALLPAMHLAQEQAGYLPAGVLAQVAGLLELPISDVLDAVSFYEMFWLRPKGRKLVQVCESFCCELCGQADLLGALTRRLGIGPDETTADGQFTLITVQCLAACDRAPVVQVNDMLFGPVGADKLDEVLSTDTPSISHDTLVRALDLRRELKEKRRGHRPTLDAGQ